MERRDISLYITPSGGRLKNCAKGKAVFLNVLSERLSGQSKETGLVIYLAFLAKVANLYYIILTAFKKYWPDTVANLGPRRHLSKSKGKSKHLYILS